MLAGQPVELNCTVLHSEDTVNITWGAVDVNGTPILLTNIVIFTEENVTTSSVRFSSISPEQAGIYNCTTTDGQSADSASFRLSVISKCAICLVFFCVCMFMFLLNVPILYTISQP